MLLLHLAKSFDWMCLGDRRGRLQGRLLGDPYCSNAWRRPHCIDYLHRVLDPTVSGGLPPRLNYVRMLSSFTAFKRARHGGSCLEYVWLHQAIGTVLLSCQMTPGAYLDW